MQVQFATIEEAINEIQEGRMVIAKGGEAFLNAVGLVRDIADLGGVAEAFLAGECVARVAAA